MNCKSSNITYFAFLAITLPIFILIMSTAFTASADKSSQSVDYNEVVEFRDYYVKISDAIYLTDTDEIIFTYNVKPKFENTSSSLPEIKSVTTNLSYKTPKPLECTGKSGTAQFFTASKIEEDFSFFTIYIITKTPDQEVEATYDEFGAEIPGEIIEGETIEIYIRIDKKDMQSMTSEDKKTLVTTQPVITTAATTETTTTATNRTAATSVSTTTVTTTATATSTAKTTSVTTKQNQQETVNNTVQGGNYGGGNSYQNGGGQAVAQPSYDDNNYQTQQTQQQQPAATTTQRPQTTAAPATTRATQAAVVHPNAISLDTGFSDNNVKLSVGNSHVISAVVKPDNATNKAVTWESNRTDIATVDENGKITAISKGKAIITAKTKDGGLSASCMVTVS